ncbi:hypothetical protein [uncultured Maricaulis sp.]|uniref:hypothetical protein n=1 Tax=uncultured Maricaulis sp. TaxID=174710 RepID=UPI0026259928|nr:hypothetical protein [uncultured Maricaulis sp.]
MSDDPNDKPQGEANILKLGLPLGLPVGIALGVSMGVALDNFALGLSMGVAFAVSMSLAFGAAKAKELKKKQDAADTGDASEEEKS